MKHQYLKVIVSLIINLGGMFIFVNQGCPLEITKSSLYDDNGEWYPGDDTLLKHEFILNSTYQYFICDTVRLHEFYPYGTYTASEQRIEDTFNFDFTYRYYMNARYNNPNVPFAYIPYNYRADYFELKAGFSREQTSWRKEPSLEAYSRDWHYLFGVNLNLLYHLSNFHSLFWGAGLGFSRRAPDDLFGDNWIYERFDLALQFGCYTSRYKCGFYFETQSVTGNRDAYYPAGDKVVIIKPFVEFTPRPNLRLKAALDYSVYTSDGTRRELAIPLTVDYLLLPRWWELSFNFVFFKNEFDDKTMTIGSKIQKYYNRFSFYLRPEYVERRRDGTRLDKMFTLLNIGLEYTFGRKIIVSASGYYGFGDNEYYEDRDDLDRSGVKLRLHLLNY